jgi:hypothetical protein
MPTPIQPKRILIVEENNNPSTDYFVMPHAQTLGLPITKLHWKDVPTAEQLDQALVIIVRYLTPAWKKYLEQARDQIAALAYFMDDDIPDTTASRGLPLKYRFKLARYGAWQFNWLMQQHAQLWVSTEFLKTKYAVHQPIQLTPQQIPIPTERYRVFYHATASHRAEIEWLHPVMAAVLKKEPRIDFEIIGDHETHKLYRKLPRTTVVHPMSWGAYQSFIAQPGRHLGLAPYIDSPFNAARSHTKVFDIQRAGARGIYAEGGPWSRHQDRDKMVLLPMVEEVWVDEITKQSGLGD